MTKAEIGKSATLKVARLVDFGAYLEGGELGDILLPARYIDHVLHPGDEMEVFIYRDSEDRPVATTDRPVAQVGEVAWLRVSDVNKMGAFLDWGLPKDLLVPFREQKSRMAKGRWYPVYIYLDHNSGRIAATAKIEKYIGNLPPDYHPGDRVEGMVYRLTPIGPAVVVDNLHHGLLYSSDLDEELQLGQKVTAYVKHVRPDGKIDLTLTPPLSDRLHPLEDAIAARLKEAGGSLPLGDKSSPVAIRNMFGCSKKDFKRAIGALYRDRVITILPDSITLNAPENH